MGGSCEEKAKVIITALGGKANIASIMCCATRLRIDLVDISLMDEKAIRNIGAYYIMKLGGGAIQIIWGPTADIMEDEIKRQLKTM